MADNKTDCKYYEKEEGDPENYCAKQNWACFYCPMGCIYYEKKEDK